jgi:Ca2+-binding RTX toxin-like protein
VDWRVRGDGLSAADGDDFNNGLPSGRLRFAPGETSRNLTVMVRGDRLQEADETLVVEIQNASGARIEAPTASGTIQNDDRIGSGGKNRLVGTNLSEFFDGRNGRDRLTGGGGADVFGFRFGQSQIGTPDRITDFRFGEDKVDLFRSNGRDLGAPKRFSRAADNGRARTLSQLARTIAADADGRAPGKQRLNANSATLIRATRPEIKGTYLLINDSNPGLDLSRDLMVDISGFNGRLPRLGSLRVDSVFA